MKRAADNYICPIMILDDQQRVQSPDIDGTMMIPYIYQQVTGMTMVRKITDHEPGYFPNAMNGRIARLNHIYQDARDIVVADYVAANIANVVFANFASYIEAIAKELYPNDDYKNKMSFYMSKDFFDIPSFDDIVRITKDEMFNYFGGLDQNILVDYSSECDEEFINRSGQPKVYDPLNKKVYMISDHEVVNFVAMNLCLKSDIVFSFIVNNIFEKYINSHINMAIASGALDDLFGAINNATGTNIPSDDQSAGFKYTLCASYMRERATNYLMNIKDAMLSICINASNMIVYNAVHDSSGNGMVGNIAESLSIRDTGIPVDTDVSNNLNIILKGVKEGKVQIANQ